MDCWVLKAESADGGIIDALPEGSPANWKFSRGESLVRQFPVCGKVSFSDHFPERRKLYDFVKNTVGVLLVSSRVKRVLEDLHVGNVEFLPVSMCDHQWNPVAEGYEILNVLGSEDVIDLEKSDVDIDPITKKEVTRVGNLVLTQGKIDPKADIFRARNMMELILISDRTKLAFERAGLTGFRAHPAEGFDDMFA
ncbi:imm11 family protein [Myxococcus sp. 1LA]